MTDDLRVRHGNRNPQNIYAIAEDGTETFAAVAMSPELADWFVDAINAADDTRPGPTQWAYDQACKALEKHRQRADRADGVNARYEAASVRVRELHASWTYKEASYCRHCSENAYPDYQVAWPCPTIRALVGPPIGAALDAEEPTHG